MNDYFIINVYFNKLSCFLIWNEDSAFVKQRNDKCVFNSLNELYEYAEMNDISLDQTFTVYDFNLLLSWLENVNNSFDCTFFLDSWNFFSDLARSICKPYIGDSKKKNINNVYDKLFFGCNLDFLQKSNELYTPNWSKKEILLLKTVLIDGINLLKESF